jgi:hypothetical protein
MPRSNLTTDFFELLTNLQSPQLSGAPDWSGLWSLAQYHRLAGEIFSQHQARLPAHVRTHFQRQYQLQDFWNQEAIETLRTWAAHLSPHEPAPILLKGWAMIGDIYPDRGSRLTADIDMLVPPNQQALIDSQLSEMGFAFQIPDEKIWGTLEHKYEYAQTHAAGCTMDLEFHERLYYEQSANIEWQTEASLYPPFRRLAAADHLFHLIVHLVYQHTWYHLYWLVDIARFVERRGHEVDQERFRWLVKKEQMQSVVAATDFVLRNEWKLQLPASCAFGRPYRKWCCERLLTRDFLCFPQARPGHYWMIKHLQKDNWFRTLRYDGQWLMARLRGRAAPNFRPREIRPL